jgi:hypothetical protein
VRNPEKPPLRIVDAPTPAQVAEHVVEWLQEVVKLARHAELTRTAYLLEMAQNEARLEAEEQTDNKC